MTYRYTHRLMHLSLLVKEASIRTGWRLTQKAATGQEQKIKYFRIFSPNLNIPHLILPKVRGFAKEGAENLQELEVVDDYRRQCLLDRAG